MTTRVTTARTLFGISFLNGKLLIYYLICSLSLPVHALDETQIIKNEEFNAVVKAVAYVSDAMVIAAEKPTDGYRLKRVADSFGRLPTVLRSLAAEFQANRLKDEDLIYVRHVLGDFSETSGIDKVKKFMKDPVKLNIPVLGKKFPKGFLKRVIQKDLTNYEMEVHPKYWNRVVLSILFPRIANAEEGSGCKGGGQCGGGGEGGEGGGGGGAADFLFGIAAIIAAIAPMVAAGIQADADKKIAKINADAQVTMSTIAADNSKYMADSQSRIAQQQNQIAQDINKKNNDEQTKRLGLQLAEVSAGREQSYQAEQSKRAEERALNEEKIALAQRQADDQLKLARASFNAQLTQAGLSNGLTNVTRPGGNLNVERNTGQKTGSGNVASSTTTPAKSDASLKGPGLLTGAAGQTAIMRGIASTKLVNSAIKGRGVTSEVEEDEEVDVNKKPKKKKKSLSASRLPQNPGRYRGAYTVSDQVMNSKSGFLTMAYPVLAMGSTRGFHNQKPPDSVVQPSTIRIESGNDLAVRHDPSPRSPVGSAYAAPEKQGHGEKNPEFYSGSDNAVTH